MQKLAFFLLLHFLIIKRLLAGPHHFSLLVRYIWSSQMILPSAQIIIVSVVVVGHVEVLLHWFAGEYCLWSDVTSMRRILTWRLLIRIVKQQIVGVFSLEVSIVGCSTHRRNLNVGIGVWVTNLLLFRSDITSRYLSHIQELHSLLATCITLPWLAISSSFLCVHHHICGGRGSIVSSTASMVGLHSSMTLVIAQAKAPKKFRVVRNVNMPPIPEAWEDIEVALWLRVRLIAFTF